MIGDDASTNVSNTGGLADSATTSPSGVSNAYQVHRRQPTPETRGDNSTTNMNEGAQASNATAAGSKAEEE
jgi:hypothetical protein